MKKALPNSTEDKCVMTNSELDPMKRRLDFLPLRSNHASAEPEGSCARLMPLGSSFSIPPRSIEGVSSGSVPSFFNSPSIHKGLWQAMGREVLDCGDAVSAVAALEWVELRTPREKQS
jgi:hypothetical protein